VDSSSQTIMLASVSMFRKIETDPITDALNLMIVRILKLVFVTALVAGFLGALTACLIVR